MCGRVATSFPGMFSRAGIGPSWWKSQRGSRNPARAGLVYLARSHSLATNAELAAVLGLSRAESVPNLTRRFSDWLSTDANIRKQLRDPEEVLQGP